MMPILRDMSVIKFSVEHLRWLNQRFAESEAEKILEWSVTTLPQLIQSTSFGPTGVVIIDMLHKLKARLPTIFIDTLHHFPETLLHAENMKKIYDMDLHVYRCKDAADQDEFGKIFGYDLWKDDPDRYDMLVKMEPSRRGLREMEAFAWINGRRRQQGGARGQLEVIEYSVDGRLKVNPLAYWDYNKLWRYIREKKVPYNPLHDKGYKSIGDVMTTLPVDPESDEREGRWKGSNKTECGIHIDIPNASSHL